MSKLHFANLTQYHRFLGVADPENDLFSVINFSSESGEALKCRDEDIVLSSNFYSISLKHITSGEIFYGRTKYDYKEGVLIFTAPEQKIQTKGVTVESTGRAVLFHEDFVRNHPLKDELRKYHFFSYTVNEALHLSLSEESTINSLFDHIEKEYQNKQDEFSKELILSQLSTLLKYANRYYHRQFLQRKDNKSSIKDSMIEELEKYLESEDKYHKAIPTIEQIAGQLALSPRYLSDALKVETGKTAIENLHIYIIDKAKDMLLGSDANVASIARKLGFMYPQYFSKLIKKKTGMTPTEYRDSNS